MGFISTVKGFTVSICTTVVVSVILAIIMASTSWLKLSISSLLLINYLSIAIGGIFGARSSEGKGWLVGLAVGVLYSALALILGALGGTQAGIASIHRGLGGILAAAAVGILSGMIGINLK